MARVIHIRDWDRRNPDHVYIGRSGKGLPGPFGNPVVVNRLCPVCRSVHRDAGSTLRCYEEHLVARLARDVGFRERVDALRGKTLVCFCAPGPCHGDVLARYAESAPLAVPPTAEAAVAA